MKIVDNIFYIGVNDNKLDLFEGQYPIPHGMAYNSYLIMDEKIAVMDTVDSMFTSEWLENLSKTLENKLPDYLVIHHMEPDHSASLNKFIEKYPETIIVSNSKAIKMIGQFFPELNIEGRYIEVKEKDVLSLGKTSLQFYFAAMVHWPEVMMSYEGKNKILFSADAFGKFGVLDYEDEWVDEARRYYFGIVGKYGKQVQAILKKIAGLQIKYICSLHGPVLDTNIGYYIDLYNTWSSYESEKSGVLITYVSMYGNTKKAAEILYDELVTMGVNVEIMDLARTSVFDAISSAFKFDRLVLASPTYNNGIFPFMETFINALTSRNFQNKKIGIIENGSWAISVGKKMQEAFVSALNIEFLDPRVSILSSLNNKNLEEIKYLAMKLKSL